MLDKVFKWFAPGLRIKRWIAVIFLGLIFAVLASFSLVLWLSSSRIGRYPGNELLVTTLVGFPLSAFCLITGIYRLMKSMWGLMDHRGRGVRKGMVETAYERARLSTGPKVVAIG